MSKKLDALTARLESRFGKSLTREPSTPGELTYEVPREDLLTVCRALRDEEEFCFDQLMDVCGIDYYAYGKSEWTTYDASGSGFSRGVEIEYPHPVDNYDRRFAVVYHLLSIEKNYRLRLKVYCDSEEPPIVNSVVDIWNCANWFEREAFDLYGILFNGHPDLRRLLTDYGFIGHPFRKDFPLIGNVEVRFDPEKNRVVYEPVSIEPRTLVPKTIRRDDAYSKNMKGNKDA